MIGSLKAFITLTTPQRVSNGRGGWKLDQTNADRVTIWADYDLLTLDEQIRYNEIDRVASGQFTIRFVPGITTDTFIEWDNMKFEVLQAGPHKDNPHFLVIQTREV